MTTDNSAEPADPFQPSMVYIAVTGNCFLPCVHCHIWKHRTPELPTAAWMEIIDKLGDLCAGASVKFVGGEPLIRRDLERLIAHAVSRGLEPGLCTNGWLVSERRAAAFTAAGLCSADVSLDGFSARTVDASRGKPKSFARALAAIRRLRAQPGIDVVVSSILHGHNAGEMGALLEFCEREGLLMMMQTLNRTLGVEQTADRWWESSPLWPQGAEELDAVDKALDRIAEGRARGVVLNTEEQIQAARRYYRDPTGAPVLPCPAGATEFGIDPLGLVRLCFYRDAIGSALAPGPLSHLFQSPDALRMRRAIDQCADGCRLNVSNQHQLRTRPSRRR